MIKLNFVLFSTLRISNIEDSNIPSLLEETYELGKIYNLNLYDILDEKNYKEKFVELKSIFELLQILDENTFSPKYTNDYEALENTVKFVVKNHIKYTELVFSIINYIINTTTIRNKNFNEYIKFFIKLGKLLKYYIENSIDFFNYSIGNNTDLIEQKLKKQYDRFYPEKNAKRIKKYVKRNFNFTVNYLLEFQINYFIELFDIIYDKFRINMLKQKVIDLENQIRYIPNGEEYNKIKTNFYDLVD